MNTLRLNTSDINKAAEILKNGGVVAIPTETVYGLAANTFDSVAINKIFLAKGRPSDNPLIVHIANIDDIGKIVSVFPDEAQKLAKAFWPGPLTIILPKNSNVPCEVTGGLDSVAVRFPSHKVAREIINKAGVPLVAPSANISGKPSPTKFEHVINDLDGKIDAAVDGGDCLVGVESTVISLLGEKPRILRPGIITADDLKKVIGSVEIDKAVYEKLEGNQKVLSPGTKYKHYSPRSEVIMVAGNSEDYSRFVNSLASSEVAALCFEEDIPYLKIPYICYGRKKDFDSQAHNLFDALRKSEEMNVYKLYAHFEENSDIGMAVYNRLIRAAGFNVIKL